MCASPPAGGPRQITSEEEGATDKSSYRRGREGGRERKTNAVKAPSKPLSQRTKREICIFKLIFKAFFHGKASSFEEWPSSTLQHQLFPRRLFLPSSAETGAMNNRLFSQPIIDGRRWRRRREEVEEEGGESLKEKKRRAEDKLNDFVCLERRGGGNAESTCFYLPLVCSTQISFETR